MPEKKTKLKAGCGIAMVFGAGFACGAIALFLVIMWLVPLSEGLRQDESKQFITNHIARQLALTEEQIKEARPVVHAAIDKRNTHLLQFVEADIELTEQAFEELKPLLTEEQIEKANKMLERWKCGKQRIAGARSK